LRLHCPVQFPATMTENVAPDRTDAVQVAPTIDVNQPASLGPLDDEWLGAGVFGHLCKRMPDVRDVPLSQLFLLLLRKHRRSFLTTTKILQLAAQIVTALAPLDPKAFGVLVAWNRAT
jgi:hypothetical protein